ncbi:Predicted dehydrogenase [Loktanella fryxellensis]|uniref:Predicted dehydrogenase n=1 Tax=Loktanella fryxellensis TaxID=245187 RepID=A0A1H8GHZ7_9RHOB|nr:Gfo/Idh/MocA family oxidoreductase [Loktanella fryxellensis]SEN43603.1 Predicted dehydrogenase [Loktanella fryxellensis]
MRWGILGAANFAMTQMGPAIHAAKGAELVALATSDPAKATGFSDFAPGLRVHDSYDALLADPDVDAVYVPLPNHLHVEWSVKALQAGKHVLCEKPIALHADEIDRVIAARDASGLLAAEAFMIVHHPQFARARDLLQGGTIGQLRHVEVVFTYNNPDRANIRNRPETGGGGLPDIGVYAFGAARFVTGAEPVAITHARIDYENGVDVFAQVAADFGDFTYGAVVSTRMQSAQAVRFHGDTGIITLTCPFNAGWADQAELVLDLGDNTRTVERWPAVNHYVLQVEAFGRAAAGGEAYGCLLEFSRGTQTMMDMVFAKGGRG